jgi:hypothetical protein
MSVRDRPSDPGELPSAPKPGLGRLDDFAVRVLGRMNPLNPVPKHGYVRARRVQHPPNLDGKRRFV